jgi:CRISPR-associated protein Csy2
MKKILTIPRLRIHNANALSSPYTIGFPAMTAWLGFMHALQRKLNSIFSDLEFNGIAVVSHDFHLHTYKGESDFDYSIISTSNPLKKNGGRPSTIEEARCDLTVSMVIEYSGIDQDEAQEMLEKITPLLYCMKITSGDVLSFKQPFLNKVTDESETKQLMTKLMPGFCIIDRNSLIVKSMEQGQDSMDALLDYLKNTTHCEKTSITNKNKEEKNNWTQSRKQKGWLVPIAVGFQGITDLVNVAKQREPLVKHKFAESVVTLGEFVMPFRINDLDNILWHYHADLKNNIYLCQQNTPFINIKEK